MKTINTVDLRPGQAFTEAVYSESDHLFVPANVPIRQKDINLLFTWSIDVVTTEGTLIGGSEEVEISPSVVSKEIEESSFFDSEEDELPPLVDEPVQPVIKRQVNFSIKDVRQNSSPYRAYKSVIEKLNSIFTVIKSGIDVEMRVIDSIGALLLGDLQDNPNSFIDYILGGEVMGHELAKSSVNTAILSALTAQELRLPNQKIHRIVSGALLHDIGMLRLSRGITEKKGGLSNAEREQINSHPVYSSRIVTNELFGSHDVNMIALQHHERWDGTGYPDHVAGENIDLGARIVSVADAFEAMISKKSYRNSMVGYQAVKNLLADNARRFDPAVIMAFTRIMGIYPIGSILRLNDKSVARVVNVNMNAPLRPVIQMLIDKEGKIFRPGEGAVIDLLNDKTLYIKNAINPEDFSLSNG